MSEFNVAPDSRLRDRTYGAVKAEWAPFNGPRRVVAMLPIYCVGCGKMWGYCTEGLVHVTHICQKCYDRDPTALNGYVESDADFAARVAYEVRAALGHDATVNELDALAAAGRLPKPLELLERESPYPRYTPPEGAAAPRQPLEPEKPRKLIVPVD